MSPLNAKKELASCCYGSTILGKGTDMRLTYKAREAISMATEAARIKGQILNTEHLMMALLEQEFGLVREIFPKGRVEYKRVFEATDEYINSQSQVLGESFTQKRESNIEQLTKQARKYSKEFGDKFVSVEHLVLAFAKDKRFGQKLFADVQLSCKTLKDAIHALRGRRKVTDQGRKWCFYGKYDVLKRYGKDLTAIAKARDLNHVTWRRDEIQRCIRILSKRTNHNPLLIVEHGAEKTEIVEGVAQLIADDLVPKVLMDCKLISLNMRDLVAGAKDSGEIGSRLMAVLKQVADSDGEIILFIDEIHTITDFDVTMVSMDASSILRHVLGREEIRCIAAINSSDYHKYVKNDPVINRGFQNVTVEQPSVQKTVSILDAIREQLERHYGVRISDNALTAAAYLSDKYINECPLPSKAIDLVDKAAKLKSEFTSKRTVLTDDGDVTDNDITEIVRKRAGVTLSKLDSSVDIERLLHVEEELHKSVVGQDMAVRVVVQAIKRWKMRFSDPGRPIGSFLFLGPTGVGKTELAKAVTIYLFGTEEALIRVDMSKYAEKHDVSRLVGGYAADARYEGEEHLTTIIQRMPYAVILLEGIEKAHPYVLKWFAGVMDEGRKTDLRGRVVNFNNTLILMTSDVGSQFIPNRREDADEVMDKSTTEKVMKAATSVFIPELITRVDDIVVEFDRNYEYLVDTILRQEADTISVGIEVVDNNCQPPKEKLVFKTVASC